MRLLERLDDALASIAKSGLTRQRRAVSTACGPHQHIGDQAVLSFNSNDYLGLAQDPQIKAALMEGVAMYGVGSGASHLISGHSVAHEQLETRCAELYASHIPQAQALSFSTGYMANLAVLTALSTGLDETEIFSDALNHASIIDAARLSRAKVSVYPHLDLATLQVQLAASRADHKLVVTDGVFSMDGDMAPLPALLALCETFDATLVVDDAHAFGVLGAHGLGTLQHFNVCSPRLVLMATLGKAAGVSGAFVVAHHQITQWLIQRARPYIYTTAAPPALACAAVQSLDIITGSQGQLLRQKLTDLLSFWKQEAQTFIEVNDDPHDSPCLLPSSTPIQPVMLGSNEAVMQTSQQLLDAGIWVTGIRAPTVAQGTARLRITLSAAHTHHDLMRLVDAMKRLVTPRQDVRVLA